MSLSGWRRPTSTGGVRSRANFAGAAGPHPASGEGKLVLTTGPWSQTTATGIPEGFHSGLPWKGCRERRGSEGPHAARCFTPAFSPQEFRYRFAAHEITILFSRPDHVHLSALDQHLGHARPGVVIGRHRE